MSDEARVVGTGGRDAKPVVEQVREGAGQVGASATAPDPRSGVSLDGEWRPQFPGQRPPFRPGHELSVRHGAYATLKLRPRAEEIEAALEEAAPVFDSRHKVMRETASLIGARFEAAIEALLEADPAAAQELDQRAHRWAKLWMQALDRLALTPASAARMGLAVSRARGEALRTHLAEQYADGGDGAA